MEKPSPQPRKSEVPVDPMFLNRWSPRAMSGGEISETELKTLFEAAKWAPSHTNSQPWRFLYARRNTQPWATFFSLMTENNQAWAKNAAVLLVVVSKKTSEVGNKPLPTHSYDAGSAWMSLALQGSLSGLVVHGMAGFDYEKARTMLGVPDDFQVEAMAAIGKPGKKEDLPPKLQEREFPSQRKPLADIMMEGGFKAGATS